MQVNAKNTLQNHSKEDICMLRSNYQRKLSEIAASNLCIFQRSFVIGIFGRICSWFADLMRYGQYQLVMLRSMEIMLQIVQIMNCQMMLHGLKHDDNSNDMDKDWNDIEKDWNDSNSENFFSSDLEHEMWSPSALPGVGSHRRRLLPQVSSLSYYYHGGLSYILLLCWFGWFSCHHADLNDLSNDDYDDDDNDACSYYILPQVSSAYYPRYLHYYYPRRHIIIMLIWMVFILSCWFGWSF